MLRRTLVYWLRMAIRLASWAVVASVGVYVWQRGMEQSVEDLGWLIGFLAGSEDEGQRIGNSKASRKAGEARRVFEQGRRGRTRGAGWT